MTGRFAPVELRADISHLSPGDRAALQKLVEASRIVDRIFLRQLWTGNPALGGRLKLDESPLGKARLDYFLLNKGPWSELDGHEAFVDGVPAKKPLGAGFYPADMTREEFEKWVKGLTPEAKAEAEGFFTVIGRMRKADCGPRDMPTHTSSNCRPARDCCGMRQS